MTLSRSPQEHFFEEQMGAVVAGGEGVTEAAVVPSDVNAFNAIGEEHLRLLCGTYGDTSPC